MPEPRLTVLGLEASIAPDTVKVFPEDAKPKLKVPVLLKVVAEAIDELLFNKSKLKLNKDGSITVYE